MSPELPTPRGPLSASLFAHWTGGAPLAVDLPIVGDPLTDEDLHLTLWCCYELHYHGFAGIDPDLEWDPATIGFRSRLEAAFEGALRTEHHAEGLPTDPEVALRVIGTWAGPPLSSTVERDGTRWQLQELAVHRSAYQLKEADPHTWAIPRLSGPGRAALIEIQADEYGQGVPGAAHAELFAAGMAELGLDPTFGAYIDRLPGTTLATDNLVSMFGLHRRLRGALVGHLALFEMCSVIPMSKYLTATRRERDLRSLERFYEVHVEVDAHHSVLALTGMVGPLVAAEPDLAPDVIFGAVALSHTESRFARHLLRSWQFGRSSLRPEPDPPSSADQAAAAPVPRIVDSPTRTVAAPGGSRRDRSGRRAFPSAPAVA